MARLKPRALPPQRSQCSCQAPGRGGDANASGEDSDADDLPSDGGAEFWAGSLSSAFFSTASAGSFWPRDDEGASSFDEVFLSDGADLAAVDRVEAFGRGAGERGVEGTGGAWSLFPTTVLRGADGGVGVPSDSDSTGPEGGMGSAAGSNGGGEDTCESVGSSDIGALFPMTVLVRGAGAGIETGGAVLSLRKGSSCGSVLARSSCQSPDRGPGGDASSSGGGLIRGPMRVC